MPAVLPHVGHHAVSPRQLTAGDRPVDLHFAMRRDGIVTSSHGDLDHSPVTGIV
jgi:hypothetical protein